MKKIVEMILVILWPAYMRKGNKHSLKLVIRHWFIQKVLRINSHVDWPVHYTSLIVAPENIDRGERTPGLARGCHIDGRNGIVFGKNVWVHRKGATSARENEIGIIPGSMGTPSYIVKGLGNTDSFMSCSHGAGRVMGRMQASRSLTPEECDKAMEGIVYDRWNKVKRGKVKGMVDLGEAPQAYKNIDEVIESELDLIQPLVKLRPLAVVKG